MTRVLYPAPAPLLSQLVRLQLILILGVFLVGVPLKAAAQKEPPFILPKQSELNKLRSAVISTNKGDLRLELYPEDAPWHVANFKYLADRGFYRNLPFHLYYPGYILQGGAPSAKNPNSGPGYSLDPEFTTRYHEEGTVGMARLPDSVNPERRSNGSQFYIALGEARNMNKSYTIFGKVVGGLEVLRRLEKGDTIREVTVYVRK